MAFEQHGAMGIAGEPSQLRRLLICAAAAVAAVVAYLLLPSEMGELQRRTVAIFIIAALLWATEALPLYTTSLCVIGLEILLLAETGGLATTGGLHFSRFLEPFGSSVIILFMGGFLLSAAITKHGIDRAIAARFLRPFMPRPLLLIYAVLGTTAFLSMWMSNTATAAMMLAVIAPLVRSNGQTTTRFHWGLILAVAFGANIGGIGTPIGSPPNAVALAALRHAGYDISFVAWMLMAVPLAVVLLAVTGPVLYLMFKPLPGATLPTIEPPQKIGGRGRGTLAILGITVALWLTGPLHGIDEAVIALLAAAAMTAFNLLDHRDVDSIEWNVLLLMWGGLSLGIAMQDSKLLDYVIALPIFGYTGVMMAAIVVLLGMGLSTFISNTATANLIIPVTLALSADERGRLAVLAGLCVSFAMALPISTPPNAMAFASGRIPSSAMLRAGAVVGAVALVVLLLGYKIVLPLVLGL